LEIVGLSFLGPFLAPSVFPEEDPGVAEKYFSEKIIPSELKTASKDLQQDLGGCSSFFKYFVVFRDPDPLESRTIGWIRNFQVKSVSFHRYLCF
jgi:hypothetical protein